MVGSTQKQWHLPTNLGRSSIRSTQFHVQQGWRCHGLDGTTGHCLPDAPHTRYQTAGAPRLAYIYTTTRQPFHTYRGTMLVHHVASIRHAPTSAVHEQPTCLWNILWDYRTKCIPWRTGRSIAACGDLKNTPDCDHCDPNRLWTPMWWAVAIGSTLSLYVQWHATT
jgi:hypothetical protein